MDHCLKRPFLNLSKVEKPRTLKKIKAEDLGYSGFSQMPPLLNPINMPLRSGYNCSKPSIYWFQCGRYPFLSLLNGSHMNKINSNPVTSSQQKQISMNEYPVHFPQLINDQLIEKPISFPVLIPTFESKSSSFEEFNSSRESEEWSSLCKSISNTIAAQEERNKEDLQSPKTPQNKYKNSYRLMTGRVVKSCNECIKLMQQSLFDEEENERLNYIHKELKKLSDLDSFTAYLRKFYSKRNRGKHDVFNYLYENQEFGTMLIDLIITFLNKDNLDFQDYISQGCDHKTKVVQVFSDTKNLVRFREKIESMKDGLIRKWNQGTLKSIKEER